ncbi:MAG: glycosyltransferase family 2 protein [Planctomycetes bacterium]|nr:glycosyltransferase family 2 protein [Planctomycetota bacterium]
MPTPLVSTVIPVRNRPQLVVEAVASVLGQTHRPIEVVVVDDGSTDATPQALQDLHARYPDIVRVLRHATSRGPGAGRETGMRAAAGQYVQFLDSDDLLDPTKFERQVAALEGNPEWGLVIGDVEIRTVGRLEPSSTIRKAPQLATGFPALLVARPWDTFAPLYRASVLERAGSWLPLFNEEDWEYDGRIAALGVGMGRVDGVVGTMRRRASDHLSGVGRRIRRSLAARAIARPLLLQHALQAGVPRDSAEFQHAVRFLFLLARQCGAAGLPLASKRLFQHVAAWGLPPGRRDVTWYGRLGSLLGWRTLGVLSASVDRVRTALR